MSKRHKKKNLFLSFLPFAATDLSRQPFHYKLSRSSCGRNVHGGRKAPGYSLLASGYSLAASGYSLAASGYSLAASGYSPAAPGYSPAASGYSLLAPGYSFFGSG